MNKQQYQEYLRSEHWQNTKNEKLSNARWRCEKCKEGLIAGAKLEVHHLTYDRVGHERMSDLQVLCSSCHEKVHIQGFVPKKTLSDKELDELVRATEEEIRQEVMNERKRNTS